MSQKKFPPVENEDALMDDGRTVNIPVAIEEIEVSKRTVETGKVRIRKIVHEHEELIDPPLLQEEVEVKRVSINRIVEQPVQTRYEGDVMIVPVLEEVLVAQKKWMLKEELYISRRVTETHNPQRVVLHNEEVIVERE